MFGGIIYVCRRWGCSRMNVGDHCVAPIIAVFSRRKQVSPRRGARVCSFVGGRISKFIIVNDANRFFSLGVRGTHRVVGAYDRFSQNSVGICTKTDHVSIGRSVSLTGCT